VESSSHSQTGQRLQSACPRALGQDTGYWCLCLCVCVECSVKPFRWLDDSKGVIEIQVNLPFTSTGSGGLKGLEGLVGFIRRPRGAQHAQWRCHRGVNDKQSDKGMCDLMKGLGVPLVSGLEVLNEPRQLDSGLSFISPEVV